MSQLKTEGLTVTYEADSAREASEVDADLRHTRNRGRGLAGWFDNLFISIGEFGDVIGPRALWAMEWVATMVAGYYAYLSFSRIAREDSLMSFGFGCIGIVFVLAAKMFAARWAKENFEGDRKEAMQYCIGTIILVSGLIVMGGAFRANVEEDQQSQVVDVQMQIEEHSRQIRDLGYRLEDMERSADFTSRSVDDLSMDLRRALSRTAYNRNGDDTGQPIAEFVNAGTEDFCIGSSYYVERYCPDILDIEEELQYRVQYEEAEAELATLREERDQLREQRPERSSVMSLVSQSRAVPEGVGRFFVAAMIIAIVDLLMTWLSYRSKWAWLVARKKGTL